MQSEKTLLLDQRKLAFDDFYNELIPVLVEFVGQMGINPAHEVLNHAEQFALPLGAALRDMVVNGEEDRIWLLTRVGYFVGEYFTQKYGGCWFVNDIEGTRYFCRYVVGRFSTLDNLNSMVDPFEVAQGYVDSGVPRQLDELLAEIELELTK